MLGNRRLPMTSPDNSPHASSFLHDAWFHCGIFVHEWNPSVSSACYRRGHDADTFLCDSLASFLSLNTVLEKI